VYLYDRSGLTIIATGTNFSQYLVQHVIDNSPAALAGIQKGDVITKVNGINVVFLSLEQLLKRFQAHEGTSVSLTVRRENGEMYKTSFRLKNLV
jgi:C-terminal processing protease CtpA/Prc